MSPTNTSPQIEEVIRPSLSRPRRLLGRFGQMLLPNLLSLALLVIPAADSALAATRDGTGNQVRIATVQAVRNAAAKQTSWAKQAKHAKQIKKAKQGQQATRAKAKRHAQRANGPLFQTIQAAPSAPVIARAATAPAVAILATTGAIIEPPCA